MIKNERVSEIVNEVLKEENDKTIEAFLQVEKIAGRNINIDYKSMLLVCPMLILEYVDNIEKTINYNEKQEKIIKETQKQLERWISIYEGKNIIEDCYKYLEQKKQAMDTKFREQTKNKGQEESLLKAGAKVGGIALRNLQRENNNLDGDMEEYPYTESELKMIEEYNNIIKKQEILEEYMELYCEEYEETY